MQLHVTYKTQGVLKRSEMDKRIFLSRPSPANSASWKLEDYLQEIPHRLSGNLYIYLRLSLKFNTLTIIVRLEWNYNAQIIHNSNSMQM